MTKKKKDVKLTDLEASNSEDVKGGGALSVANGSALNLKIGPAGRPNARPQGANRIPGSDLKVQRGPRKP